MDALSIDIGDFQQNNFVPDRNLNKKRRSPKSIVTKQLRELGSNTTVHGLRYVTDQELSAVEKVFWLATFLVSIGLCFYWIESVWIKWQDSPAIVLFNERLEPVWKVPFPSVTICPITKFNATKFDFSGQLKKYSEMSHNGHEATVFTDKVYEEFREFVHIASLCRISSIRILNEKYADTTLASDIMKLSPQIKNLFLECAWGGEQTRCDDIFKSVLTEEGHCFNMNSLPVANILRLDRIQRKYYYLTEHNGEAIKGWKEDNYYDPEEDDVYPRRGSEGIFNLQVIFMEHRDFKDEICNSVNTGFKVYIHQPQDMPRSSMAYYPVTPNMISLFALKVNIIDSSKDLRSVSSEIRQCYFPEERPLRYFKAYTASNCELECVTNRTYEFCGCVFVYMPHFTAKRLCLLHDMDCVGEVRKSLVNISCNCLPSCNSVDYEADVMKSDFKIKEHTMAITNTLNRFNGSDYIKDLQFSSLQMYYKHPRYISMRRSLVFGTTEFLANCGGLLGLFLGFSFLSLVEIIYFVTLRLYCKLKRIRDIEESREKMKQRDTPFSINM